MGLVIGASNFYRYGKLDNNPPSGVFPKGFTKTLISQAEKSCKRLLDHVDENKLQWNDLPKRKTALKKQMQILKNAKISNKEIIKNPTFGTIF